MQGYIKIHNHYIDKSLYKFIQKDLSNDLINFDSNFWTNLSESLSSLEKIRIQLIEERKKLQNKINKWHIDNKNKLFNKNEYKNFLFEIGYLIPEKEDFKIKTKNVDDEISSVSGPQLVVP